MSYEYYDTRTLDERSKKAFFDLLKLRENIKNKESRLNGKKPTVCSDDSLLLIAKELPVSPEDFKAISGLGETFVKKYAIQFAEVTKKHKFIDTTNIEVIASENEIGILRQLSQRLIDLNKRNKLLHLVKLRQKDSFDLFSEISETDKIERLFRGEKLQICNRSDTDDSKKRYKELTTLFREVSRIFREKGQYNLFLANPFVIGKAQNEDFIYRAPLALYPMLLEQELDYFVVSLDQERDIVYNKHLLVANNKFNRINKTVDDVVVESNGTMQIDFNKMKEYYAEKGMEFKNEIGGYSAFLQYTSNEIPNMNNGDYFIENCLILGIFPVFSSSIAVDFNNIIENKKINNLLRNLISGIESADKVENFSGYYKDDWNDSEIKEIEITYINDLNSSQEKVLKKLGNKEALVVEGPPGTGKSQTITSLITHNIFSNKSILLVSEKKAALDVVFSRLGDLSKNAILIDDVNNKHSFYEHLARITSSGRTEHKQVQEISSLSNGIEKTINDLRDIAKKLYETNSFGLEIYKSYQARRIYNLDSEDDRKLLNFIKINLSETLEKQNYQSLRNLSMLIEESNYSNQLIYYIEVFTRYPYIKYLRDNISELEIYDLLNDLKELEGKIISYKFKNRLLTYFVLLPKRLSVAKKIKIAFHKKPKKWFRNVRKGNEFFSDMLKYPSEIITCKKVFDSLDFLGKQYLIDVSKIHEYLKDNVVNASKKLFNYFLINQVISFEKENALVLRTIDNYEKIIDDLNKKMDDKKKITRDYIESILRQSINDNIVTSKRSGDIMNKINSRRRWSVNKFINTFGHELFNGIKIWMLTPEVVSELLPLRIGLIDVVIFDEASQMYIEKGIPAILRAKQVVIAGDSKQLRPAKLGSGRIDNFDDEEDYDIETALDEESLLDVAKTKYYPPIPLNFHYRSKYAELINFSNHAFYGAELKVSPNIVKPPIPPIRYSNVKGIWNNKRNSEEAKEVVRLVSQILNEREDNETIGIITFNSSQREEIYDQIDDMGRDDGEFAIKIQAERNRKYNGEDVGLFIKNIENVQGDERDIIIFSIGYGFNTSGRFSMQFGWLNQVGGENRLNVAITRAKKQVYIVASINPGDFDVSNSKNNGPKLLKKYLEYAEAVSCENTEMVNEILTFFT
jgi:hypothetical protein